MSIRVENLGKKFTLPADSKTDGDLLLFDNFFLSCENAKVSVLMGPSGCGKTTLLNLLAGLLHPDRGSLSVNDRPAKEARVSYLFQEPRLLPWLTVEENLDFVLSPDIPRRERKALIRSHLTRVSLDAERKKYPAELSGGMAQRAAMARAFVFESEALLMDEPFQGLDQPLKFSLIDSLRSEREATPKTTLFVTHDMREALLLGDEISVLSRPPSRVVFSLANPVPPEERRPSHGEFPMLEKKLFEALR